jgi:hypothetical protein
VITYAERACFQPSHLRLLARVEVHVGRVSRAWGNELRCHELARAVHQVVYDDGKYKLDVVDGKCGPVEHSWLRFYDGVILDAYVPGRLPAVQLVDPLVAAYRPGSPRRDISQAIVDRLVGEMRGVTPRALTSQG